MLSDDLVRAQAFAHAAAADVLRRLHLARALSKEAAGKTTLPTLSGAPPQAIVLEGLRPRPEVGTTNFFVEPGALAVSFPDPSPHPDDCPTRLIFDGGVQTAGALTLTAGSGSVRVDVVECQPTTIVVESDSRDVFNPATGTSSPVTLDKVTRGALAYRIRTGTPGGGFPGVVADWLPLAVCTVSSAAATWDDVQVWDVRPLLADLADPPHVTTEQFPAARRRQVVAVEPSDAAGEWRAKGVADLALAGWKAGGQLATTLSGASHLRLDALDAALTTQEPSFSVVADRPWYLYLAQPFFLPRWSKLSPASSGERTPTEPRGVPVFSQKAPSGLSGIAGSALALPIPTGLGGSSSNAVVAASGMFSGSFFCGSTTGAATDLYFTVLLYAPTSGAGTLTPVFTLTAGTHFPPNAVALRLEFSMRITLAGGTISAMDRDVHLKNAAGTESYSGFRLQSSIAMPAGGVLDDMFSCWVELPLNLPSGASGASFLASVDYAVSGTLSLQKVQVKGWKLA